MPINQRLVTLASARHSAKPLSMLVRRSLKLPSAQLRSSANLFSKRSRFSSIRSRTFSNSSRCLSNPRSTYARSPSRSPCRWATAFSSRVMLSRIESISVSSLVIRDLSSIWPPHGCLDFAAMGRPGFDIRQVLRKKVHTFDAATWSPLRHFWFRSVYNTAGDSLTHSSRAGQATRMTALGKGPSRSSIRVRSGKVDQVARIEAVLAVSRVVDAQYEGDGGCFE